MINGCPLSAAAHLIQGTTPLRNLNILQTRLSSVEAMFLMKFSLATCKDFLSDFHSLETHLDHSSKNEAWIWNYSLTNYYTNLQASCH